MNSPISNDSCVISRTSTIYTNVDGDGDVDIGELLNDVSLNCYNKIREHNMGQ